MTKPKFSKLAATPANSHWDDLIRRPNDLYSRKDDVRSPFARDYTRILHSMAYRRLKHKTQVFFNTNNDHICTRMEHVSHVESVSSTIAHNLGLNTELTKAISIGHDLGHAPFGHQGEVVIKSLTQKYLHQDFWHEANGLRFVDKIELLEDNYKDYQNLNLSYAVRDGIISHCGEVDQNGIHPRDFSIPIEDFDTPGKHQAATWEGCVVKMADKIAYIGRDIEDAISLGFLDASALRSLERMARARDERAINNTVIMHNMIIDICEHSSPEKGIALSEEFHEQLTEIKQFNYKYIYGHKRLEPFKEYSKLVIEQIFNALLALYPENPRGSIWNALNEMRSFTPKLIDSFERFLVRYCLPDYIPSGELKNMSLKYCNTKIYGELENQEIYIQAIIDYISGMTDRFAIELFNELLEY